MERISIEALRNHLLQYGIDKYAALFTGVLQRCMSWVGCLELQMQQHFPERMFVDLYNLVVKKYTDASNHAQTLMELVEVLKGNSTYARSAEAIIVLSYNIVDYLKMEHQGIMLEPSGNKRVSSLDSEQRHRESLAAIIEADVACSAEIAAQTKEALEVRGQSRENVESKLRFRDHQFTKPLGMRNTFHATQTRNSIEKRSLPVAIPELRDDESAKRSGSRPQAPLREGYLTA